jgi:uncharacterized protein (DUF1778 family)
MTKSADKKQVNLRLEPNRKVMLDAMVDASGKGQEQFIVDKLFAPEQDGGVLAEVVKSQQLVITSQQETIDRLSKEIAAIRQKAYQQEVIASGDSIQLQSGGGGVGNPNYYVDMRLTDREASNLLTFHKAYEKGDYVVAQGWLWYHQRNKARTKNYLTAEMEIPEEVLSQFVDYNYESGGIPALRVMAERCQQVKQVQQQYADLLASKENCSLAQKLTRVWVSDSKWDNLPELLEQLKELQHKQVEEVSIDPEEVTAKESPVEVATVTTELQEVVDTQLQQVEAIAAVKEPPTEALEQPDALTDTTEPQPFYQGHRAMVKASGLTLNTVKQMAKNQQTIQIGVYAYRYSSDPKLTRWNLINQEHTNLTAA